jgi:uncharacterized protein (DUF58 family)
MATIASATTTDAPGRPGGQRDQDAINSEQAPYLLDRNRVYIFPTRHGWMFGVMLTVMLLGSINYNNSLSFLLTFLLAGIGLVGIAHTYRNMAGLSYIGGRAKHGFAGEEIEFLLKLDNRAQSHRYALEFCPAPRRRRKWFRKSQALVGGTLVDIAPDSIATVQLRVPAQSRGVLALGRIRVETHFPLGLIRGWAYIETGLQALVYPRTAGAAAIPQAFDESHYQRDGGQIGVEDFVGFRDYRPGDSPRSIAWKVAAKGGGLLIKRFTGSGASTIWLGWQDTEGLGDMERRLSQMSRWVLTAHGEGLHYGLRLPSVEIARKLSDEHREQCLKALALFEKPSSINPSPETSDPEVSPGT